jgi:hypothetical protein
VAALPGPRCRPCRVRRASAPRDAAASPVRVSLAPSPPRSLTASACPRIAHAYAASEVSAEDADTSSGIPAVWLTVTVAGTIAGQGLALTVPCSGLGPGRCGHRVCAGMAVEASPNTPFWRSRVRPAVLHSPRGGDEPRSRRRGGQQLVLSAMYELSWPLSARPLRMTEARRRHTLMRWCGAHSGRPLCIARCPLAHPPFSAKNTHAYGERMSRVLSEGSRDVSDSRANPRCSAAISAIPRLPLFGHWFALMWLICIAFLGIMRRYRSRHFNSESFDFPNRTLRALQAPGLV